MCKCVRGCATCANGKTPDAVKVIAEVSAPHDLAAPGAGPAVVSQQLTNALIMTDVQGCVQWANDAFVGLTGFGIQELRGRKPGEMLQGSATDPATVQQMRLGIVSGEGFDVEIINYTKDGKPYWTAVSCSPLRDAIGTLTGFIAIQSDVSRRRAAEDSAHAEAVKRERAETLLRDVLDTVPTAITAYDADERFILCNRAYTEMFPVAASFAEPGRRYEEVVRHAVQQGQYADAGTTPEEQEAWIALQMAHHRGPGGTRTLAVAEGRVVLAGDRRSDSGNLVCVRADITDLKRAEQALRLQAERDPLTLLANRTSFLAAIDEALRDVARGNNPGGALMLLDIDHFKQINDTLGHDTGDALLVEIATRLRGLLRGSDVAARLGGDEFGVILPGLVDPGSLTDRMDAIHGALSAPLELAGRRLSIGVSFGVTIYPADGTDGAKLLKNADLALYEAKRQGRGRWSAFRPEQFAAMEHNSRLADALRTALAQNRIAVALQPKRWLRGDGHAGFEALARWHDGTRWVPPSEFIPVAEDTGLIGPLGRAVMEATLARVRELRACGLDPGRVAVNVTGPQLLDSHFIQDTLAALERHGLRPGNLELELTETVLFGRAAERVDAVLRQFSQLGITLALDDFGTGYASLSHLSRLPIDRLKIDSSFVAGIGGGGPGGVIARTVVSLAHSLEMEVIAEGIETTGQLAFLEAAGCDMGQGHLFSKPLLTTREAVNYLRGRPMRHEDAADEALSQSWCHAGHRPTQGRPVSRPAAAA